jgi:hypothetical protein
VRSRELHAPLLRGRVALLVIEISIDLGGELQQLDLELRLTCEVFLDPLGAEVEQLPRGDFAAGFIRCDARIAGAEDAA